MNGTRRAGVGFVLLAALGYSLFSIFVKRAYDGGASPLDVIGWRFAFALPVVWAVAAVAGQWRSRDVPRLGMVGAGVLFAAVALAAVGALQRLPASLYVVVIYTYPAMVTLAGVARGHRPTARTWCALALATVGVVLTVPDVLHGFGGVDGVGLALTLLNAALYAAYIVLSGHLLAGRSALVAAAAWSITGSALVAGVLFASGHVHPVTGRSTWAALVGLAVVSTVLAGAAFLAGLRRLGPTPAAILSTVEPVLAIVWAVTFLHETLQPLQVVGAVAVLGSAVLLELPARTVTDIGAEVDVPYAVQPD